MPTLKMSDSDAGLLKLIGRSQDNGDGWRQVSPMLWPSVCKFGAKELIEFEPIGTAGRVRLTPTGTVLLPYIA